MGMCVPDLKLILINSHFSPGGWADTWLHEARHAWHNHSPRPTDEEAVIDWETTVSRESHAQFTAQGGEPALQAMQPVSGVAPRDVVAAASQRRRQKAGAA